MPRSAAERSRCCTRGDAASSQRRRDIAEFFSFFCIRHYFQRIFHAAIGLRVFVMPSLLLLTLVIFHYASQPLRLAECRWLRHCRRLPIFTLIAAAATPFFSPFRLSPITPSRRHFTPAPLLRYAFTPLAFRFMLVAISIALILTPLIIHSIAADCRYFIPCTPCFRR